MEKLLLALAIEDRVDLLAWCDGEEWRFPPEGSPAADIPEGGDYFAAVHGLITDLFKQLREKFHETEAGDLFNSVAALVVSTPGVVKDNRTLLQLPLWHSNWSWFVQWQLKNEEDGKVKVEDKKDFDFPTELAAIAAGIITGKKDKQGNSCTWRESERARFMASVFVVNDATAAGAFEFSLRMRQTERDRDAADFVYVKMHNGINVGVIARGFDGRPEIKVRHAEAGHGYVVPHPLDQAAQFGHLPPDEQEDDGGKKLTGACPYHGHCLEGRIAVHSFWMRAQHGGHPVFKAWRKIADKLAETLTGQDLDNALVHAILGRGKKSAAGHGEGVDLLAYYAAQLVHQLAIGPLAPKQIVLGGRMAKPKVIEAIQAYVAGFCNNYPARPELDIAMQQQLLPKDQYLVPTQAQDKDKHIIEACGALTIAFSRANMRPQAKVVQLRSMKDQ